MSGRIVVGYTATEAGAGCRRPRCAPGRGIRFRTRGGRRAPGRRPQRDHAARCELRPLPEGAAASWLARRLGRAFPTTSSIAARAVRGLVRRGAASRPPHEFGASHIVVGAANGGLRGRHRLGSVATELLHSSDVPVVLAPEGSRRDRRVDRRHPHHRGDRHAPGRRRAPRGGDVARRRRPVPSCGCSRSSRSTCRRASTPASSASPAPPTPTRCSRRRAQRCSGVIERRGRRRPRRQHRRRRRSTSAGSRARSRSSAPAASPSPARLFLGSTAAKMLHELPVPMIVVPRTRAAEGGRDERSPEALRRRSPPSGRRGTPTGLSKKGLSAGTVGLIGAVVIGISCIAPAYTLTAALGPTVSEVGFQVPAIILVGFIPMLLVAFGYRELNRRCPTRARPSPGRRARSGRGSAGWPAGA